MMTNIQTIRVTIMKYNENETINETMKMILRTFLLYIKTEDIMIVHRT